MRKKLKCFSIFSIHETGKWQRWSKIIHNSLNYCRIDRICKTSICCLLKAKKTHYLTLCFKYITIQYNFRMRNNVFGRNVSYNGYITCVSTMYLTNCNNLYQLPLHRNLDLVSTYKDLNFVVCKKLMLHAFFYKFVLDTILLFHDCFFTSLFSIPFCYADYFYSNLQARCTTIFIIRPHIGHICMEEKLFRVCCIINEAHVIVSLLLNCLFR